MIDYLSSYLFHPHNVDDKSSLRKLKEMGGNSGLCKDLKTDENVCQSIC
jgi:hypothetical protein